MTDLLSCVPYYWNKALAFTLISIPLSFLVSLFFDIKELILVMTMLVILDIISGVIVAMKHKCITSRQFSKSMFKLLAYVFAIGAVRLLEYSAFDNSFMLSKMMIGILAVTEGISILENSILMGLPLPKLFLNIIEKQSRYSTKKKV